MISLCITESLKLGGEFSNVLTMFFKHRIMNIVYKTGGKNMKKIISTLLAFIVISSSTAFAFDDIKDTMYEKEITELAELGYINGYEDNTFRPEGKLTRAEAARLLIKALYPDQDTWGLDYSPIFSDLGSDHWAWEEIHALTFHQVINGFEDGTFRANENVTAAQAVNMCLKLTGYTPFIEKGTNPWYKGVMNTARTYGFIESLDLKADEYITRQQMAKLIYNTINTPLAVVTGWDGGLQQIELADGKDGREYRTLLTEAQE